VTLVPWNNVRESLLATGGDEALEEQARGQDAAHAGEVAAMEHLRREAPRRIARHLHAIVVGATVSLLMGLRDNDAGGALDCAAGVEGYEFTGTERDDLVEALQPLVAYFERLGPEMERLGTDRTTAARRMGLGPDRAPGLWLAGRLSEGRIRNRARAPLRSDMIDLAHAAHYPYVDVATCDRQAHAELARFIGDAAGSRVPNLLRNGQLPAVLEHVQSLPTGDAIHAALAMAQPNRLH
jgi:hypothetical protein